VSAVVILAVAGALSVFSACSNNGEGERCESANGSDDCQDGLICVQERCCPPDRSRATAAACKDPAGQNLNDASPAPDSGPDTSVPDTGVDTSVPDTGTDAADASDAADAADAADGS